MNHRKLKNRELFEGSTIPRLVIISIVLPVALLSDLAFAQETVEQPPESHLFFWSVAASLVAAIIFLPVQSIAHWLNSRLIFLYRFVRWGSCGFEGTWLAIYTLHPPNDDLPRYETAKVSLSVDKEVRGSIQAWKSYKKYKFVGKIIGNEMVAHYWPPKHGERDSGSFKIILDNRARIAKGNLIYYDSVSNDDKKTSYIWRRWNKNFYEKLLNGEVRIDTSMIHDQGIISQTFFEVDDKIGNLSKKYVNNQGKHTLEVEKNKHYLIKKPWCYLNHSCNPNATMKIENNKLSIFAKRKILPEEEITFDYRQYEKTVSKEFACKCPQCKESDDPYLFKQQ